MAANGTTVHIICIAFDGGGNPKKELLGYNLREKYNSHMAGNRAHDVHNDVLLHFHRAIQPPPGPMPPALQGHTLKLQSPFSLDTAGMPTITGRLPL
jgi:hypothetical protein